jgi:hypothetical protein
MAFHSQMRQALLDLRASNRPVVIAGVASQRALRQLVSSPQRVPRGFLVEGHGGGDRLSPYQLLITGVPQHQAEFTLDMASCRFAQFVKASDFPPM